MSIVSWEQLRGIRSGTIVVHWSILKGNLDGKFSVSDVSESGIDVETGPGTTRRISKSDFERVSDIWPDYKNGTLGRHAINSITVNSTYILSLLHFLDPS